MLLESEQTRYLMKTLQGVLMVLPLCKSFHCLKARLEASRLTSSQTGGKDL